jgi:hypothetical protein
MISGTHRAGECVMLGNGIDNRALHVESLPMWALPCRPDTRPDWRTIDRALRAIRKSRAALDAEEMHWLREAEAQQIWRPLGMVSALDYLERVLGYAPRTAQDRLRVARALGSLPRLTAALATDQLPFSAVRELTRVATPGTEAVWISAVAGKNLRQIEELVADHRPGDRPDDPPDPQARVHVVRLELAADTFALWRQARTVLDDEHGTNLPDNDFIAALCNAVLDGASTAEPTGRAKFQVAVTVCRSCQRGWQEGAGAQIAWHDGLPIGLLQVCHAQRRRSCAVLRVCDRTVRARVHHRASCDDVRIAGHGACRGDHPGHSYAPRPTRG